jgi:hypothetical protein
MKASMYGIANLKRIVPNLIQWSAENGKDYGDLEELYGQVLVQWNRYNGHVKSTIGGVYETFKSYEQEGSVFTPVPKNIQKEAMVYLQKQAFSTPTWLLDQSVLKRIEHAGSVDRIRNYQANLMNQLLDPSRIARLIEAESILGKETYTPLDLFAELRMGLWSELASGKPIDTYRRNLQRAFIERLDYLMKEEPTMPSANTRSMVGYTPIDVSQSDIRPIARAELKNLKTQIAQSMGKVSDRMTRYHLEDCIQRINLILDPK